ncbi:PREDICTED: uncharacterized protein C15orf39 homolog, partial [Chaetura pelagica]|uniref:uncharacterized protein C15orf39 homolog n=1 Tax=Chaetura pelagica TaxID=8897 RepID=UPI000523A838
MASKRQVESLDPSYFPLDTYVPRAAGTSTVGSPPAEPAALPRDADPPRPPGCLTSPGFAFSPGDGAAFGASSVSTEPESPRQPPRHSSAFQPLCTPEQLAGGSSGLAPKGERGWVEARQGEQEPPYLGRSRASSAPQETHHGGPPAPRSACKVKDSAKKLVVPSPATLPPGELKDPRDGEVSPSSPPMPVINYVFSLAPYRHYLERTEASAQVPFPRDPPPRPTGGSREPTALGDISATASDTMQSREERCHGEAEKPEPQDTGSQESSPGGVGSEELVLEAVVLDLSLKKSLEKSGESQGVTSPGEIKSTFQSSATFMFKKFKIRRSLPPSNVPPREARAPQLRPRAVPRVALAPQQPLLPQAPRAAGNERAWPVGLSVAPAAQGSAGHFTTLHTSLCHLLSCSVSQSSPQLLREWLKRAEPAEELGEAPKLPLKPKNSSRSPEPQKATKGKEIWLAFQDVASLLTNLLSQLETFMFSRQCPFPHVFRAGAIFIPIHVVKEKLFPKLPGASVDQVLQEHKVELRPTTLSEERHLRDLELKSCTSRMLKLLALKQLRDIYPDLLTLHWHSSIRQQLAKEHLPEAAGEAFTPAELVPMVKPPEISSPLHVLPLQFRLLGLPYTHALSRRSSRSYQELEGEVRLLLGRSRMDILESLISEVTLSLSGLYHVRNFTITQLRNTSGFLEVTGDLYLDTIVHADVAEVLQALTALAACSVDLTSLWVEGARPHLQVYPVSFLVTNRPFSQDLLDPAAAEQQELTRDLGDAVARALKDQRSFLQVVIRGFLPGSLICHGDVVFQHPAPTSLEVLEALVLSLGPSKALAGSDFEVDPYSLAVGGDTLEPPQPQPGFPEYGVAILVLGGFCLITAPLVLLL